MSMPVDNIELLLPFKAEYVSIARLTVSGIASRMGFDIDTVEDIKVAVAEVCNRIVSIGSKLSKYYKINFAISEQSLKVLFTCEDKSIRCIFNNEDAELAVSIIKALMDDVEFCTDGSYILSMTKSIGENM
ncbi:MAG TPA: anti-sigma regulatory factor [Clostridiaceae bacterium]|nr:anti-sigma regulatory factor [Clostridiaceae bacterium]